MKNEPSIKILAEGKTNSKGKDLLLFHASTACPLKKPPSLGTRRGGHQGIVAFPNIPGKILN
jgi:hypothetical protein